jgi:multidrug efflux pump subunit AcrB
MNFFKFVTERRAAFNVSELTIRRPSIAIFAACVALTLGIIGFRQLPITLLPNVDPPLVSVLVTDFGATPTELETQVTEKVEAAVSGIPGVHHKMSSISDGVSLTTISFDLSVNTDHVTEAVRRAVAQIAPELPRGADAPVVKRVTAVGLNIVTYAASSPKLTPMQLSAFVDTKIVGGLKLLPGVGSVERIGGVTREISVALDPVALAMHGLTLADLHAQEQTARGNAHAGESISELAATPIRRPHGGVVRLDALAHIVDGSATARTFARVNGAPMVGFGVIRAKGASDVAVAGAVEKFVQKVAAANPDVSLKLIDTSVRYTQGNYDVAMHTLFEGAVLAVIVVFLFLRNLRATIIAALALPLSIIPAFFVMHVLGFSLNLISLLAITLATGILVDDAIVEIENIVRHMRMGKSAMQAAIDAANEIGLAVIAISLTIVAVFAPVSFIGSIAGLYFKQFGLTIAAEVIFSLLAARFVTPMLAAYFLKPQPADACSEKAARWIEIYGRIVTWSIEHRFKTVFIGLVLFGLSILSITSNLVSRDFQPIQDSGRSHLAIELAPGATLKDTQAMADNITARLQNRREVTSVFGDGGRLAPGAPEVRKAQLIVNYVPKAQRKLSVAQLQDAIGKDLSAISGLRTWFVDDYGARPVVRIFTGPDGVALEKFVTAFAQEMKSIKLVSNVLTAAEAPRAELHLAPNDAQADKLGVTHDALTRTITLATIGGTLPSVQAADDQLVPVRLTLGGGGGAGAAQGLAQLQVPGRSEAVPLGAVATIESLKGPASLTRFDNARSMNVEADLTDGAALGDVEKALDALPIMKHMPPGVLGHKSVTAEAMQDLSSGFAEAMRNGLIMVYIVLMLLFARVLQPITILFSLPLSIGGAIIALLITGRPLSLPVIIGILMLMGIVTKNAIMLVDFATRAIARGMPRTAAIAEAGKKRARPIVMTTIAMVAGMMPSALGLGAGGEFRSPMAIAVIGGLIASTFLSLLFVPAVFAVMDDVRNAGFAGLHALIAVFRGPPKLPDQKFAFTRRHRSFSEPAE